MKITRKETIPVQERVIEALDDACYTVLHCVGDGPVYRVQRTGGYSYAGYSYYCGDELVAHYYPEKGEIHPTLDFDDDEDSVILTICAREGVDFMARDKD